MSQYPVNKSPAKGWEVLACFGQAKLFRNHDGCLAINDGSEQDIKAAEEWASHPHWHYVDYPLKPMAFCIAQTCAQLNAWEVFSNSSRMPCVNEDRQSMLARVRGRLSK
jgi:hypothetical protein